MQFYRKVAISAVALTFSAISAPASATTVVGSGAYGVSVGLSVLNVANVTVGPLASVTGATAASPYGPTAHLLNAGVNTALLASTGRGLNLTTLRYALSTGVIDTSATGGPLPASTFSDASALVNGLNFSLKTDVLGVPLLNVFSLTASTLRATAHAGATPGAAVSSSGGITNLTLNVAGLNLIANSNAFVNAPDNTDLLGFLNLAPITGLRIIVNEVITPSTNNSNNAQITRNALHIIFNGLPIIGGQLLRGDVVVSDARAFIESANSATPEPAIWAQMITGFGLIGFATRRRRVAAAN